MGKQRCAGCGERFDARRNVLQQRFCSKPECQRARRARWQREKMAQDADYRANQAEAGRRWRERHPQYWREYRRAHPEYTARNRARQRHRNRRQRGPSGGPSAIAKMDAYTHPTAVHSGTYRLIPVAGPGVANMDAYVVEMHVLSDGYGGFGAGCKERT